MKDVVVLIDREQGGEAHLKANGLTLHAAFKLSALLSVLQKHGHVSDETAARVRAFICAVEAAWGVGVEEGHDPALRYMAHVW